MIVCQKEAAILRCSLKQVVLKISRYSQENTVLETCLVCIFHKKELQDRCFPVNIAKILITVFFIEHLQWLLLKKRAS